jgi:uncharacterized membrane protein YfcA
MDFVFPISGVETALWIPPLIAFAISFFTSMAGVSGAFLLLPFQMSVLGFTSPSVTPTNLVFNITAIPSGVYRYLRERRLVWPLTAAVVAGTLPGVVIGGFVRLEFLSDPAPFKAFVGFVLLYIGLRLLQGVVRARRVAQAAEGASDAQAPEWSAETIFFNWRTIEFGFRGEVYRCSTPSIAAFSFLVGMVGGAYGIGGGAIVAPVFVTLYRLPVHAVAGATLMGTFTTSVVGVLFFQAVAPYYSEGGVAVGPDWLLGALFGVGGVAGMYLGARTQKFVPAVWLKLMLGLIVLIVAVRYLAGYFLG